MPANESYNFKNFNSDIDTAGVVNEEQLSGLSEEGYVAVLNLLPEDSEYAITNEKKIVESQNIQYHYRAVDFSDPSKQDYEWFESTVKGLPKGTSLFHCAANYRVSAFSSVYAFRNLGWSADQARSFISEIWDINEYPVWNTFVNTWISE